MQKNFRREVFGVCDFLFFLAYMAFAAHDGSKCAVICEDMRVYTDINARCQKIVRRLRVRIKSRGYTRPVDGPLFAWERTINGTLSGRYRTDGNVGLFFPHTQYCNIIEPNYFRNPVTHQCKCI